jgi:hypothetical protein
MKSLLIRLALPLFLVATASADWVIESTVETPSVNGALTVKVKGDKMRMDMPNARLGAVSSIVDAKTGDALQVVHAQKIAMKMDGETIKKMIANAREKAGMKEGEASEAKPTGETEKVGEYDCDIYTWTNGTITKKYWVAKSHPQAAALKELETKMRNGFFGAMQSGPDTSKLPGAAIKTESTTPAGTVRTIVTAIKEQDLDPKDFEVPEGYELKAMPAPPAAK